jgi:hypothetical protein
MEILLLNTRNNASELAAKGFSGSWSLNAKRAIGCDYVIICALGESTGVLVGKMRGLMRTDDASRFDVYFSEYAEISTPDVWTRTSQNPVGYADASSLPIDFEKLIFNKV